MKFLKWLDETAKQPYYTGEPVLSGGKVFYPVKKAVPGAFGIDFVVVDYANDKDEAKAMAATLNKELTT